MSIWYRVFAAKEGEPDLAGFAQQLIDTGFEIPLIPRGDDQGWFEIRLDVEKERSPLIVERYLATEEGMRQDLNTWAAWLETCDYSPNHVWLMERVIQSQQLFAMRRPVDHSDEARLDDLCLAIVNYLADGTDGLIQIDNQGFFSSQMELMLQEH